MAIGEIWTKVGDLPKEVSNHKPIIFNDKVWIIGGSNLESKIINNVYSSEDGIEWTYHNSHTKFNLPNITYTIPFVLGNTLFIAGGVDGTPAVTDKIWATKDGDLWVEVGNLPTPLTGHDIAVKGDRAYVIGGSVTGASDAVDTVYMSKDGIIWQQVGTLPVGLATHTVTVYGDLLLVIGGYATGYVLQEYIFNSIDGEYWGEHGPYPDSGKSFRDDFSWNDDVFPNVGGGTAGLDNHSSLVHNSELYFFGGRGCLTGCVSDQVFKTDEPLRNPNSAMFTEVGTNALPFNTLGKHFIKFLDAFWMIGGWENGVGAVKGIYRSA